MEVQDYDKLLKHAYRTAPIGLCLFDSQFRYRHINEWLAAINGIPVEAHLGRTISEVIPDVSAGVESILRGVMETGEPVLDGVVEARTPASPHQKRVFQHSYHPLRTDEGIVVGVSCIVQDITRRKRANDQLRSREERFRSVVESARDGIILTDGTSQIISWNQAAQTIFGYSGEEALGKPLTMLIPERYRESHLKGLERYAQTGEARLIGQTIELDGLRKDGSEFPLELSLSTWKSAEGRFFCGIIREITKRKRAEEELIESRNQLEERVQARTAELAQSELRHRVLLESTNAVPWEADGSTWQFTYVGPQAIKLLGYPPQQWLEANFWPSHIHPEDREFAIDYCVRSAKSKADFDFEYRMITADGRTVWIHDIVNVESERGEPKTLRGFMIDVTERKQAEEELRENATRLQLATDAARIGHWDWAISTNEVYVSPEWKRQLGYEDQELPDLFETWESRLHSDDRKRTIQLLADYIDGRQENYAIEFRLKHKDGSYRWIYTRAEKQVDDTGKAYRLFGCHIDITDRKKAEALLKDSEARFRMIYEHAPVMIDAFDENGRCVMFNKECEKVFGWSAEEVFSHENPLELFYPDPGIQRQVIETVTSMPENVFREWKPKRKDGSETLSLWANFRLPDGQVMNLGYDISEQRRAQEELRRNRDDMRELARRLITAHEDERRRIARELHDDLSQRLASIAIDSSMLESEIRPATESGADKLATLSDRIRATSVDVHQVSRQLHPSILDDLGLVKAMQAECDAFQRRSGVALRFEGPSEYSSAAKSTELALYRIMQECLRNIEKHSRAVSACVTLHVSEAEISLTVADTGTGFDPTQQREEPGLGMASLKERAGVLGGTVSIQSEIGRGTTVTAHLPAKTRES